MMATYKISIPVIDVPATSKNLKSLRESHNITVAQVQKLLGMENPQSIYSWENSENKYLPRLDNLVFLAKLYKVSIDELLVIKMEKTDGMAVCEPGMPFGILQETLEFITQTTSPATKIAIEKYYGFSLGVQ
ncbi:MAG: helix-turn-helix transcriptional regulator [Treponema sp.]|uniref:helix-turn-helix domain-containing protein n=1 Tax=Treponema sp. TaxID=166 RepID=UPI002A91982D|nr:helix-turn-helix transcriptional regulator [Treponema sp.]MDY6398323.1 helix-turn-helix transcriptional regulator [Treponema sp.]